jgi:hypothetical protein
MAKIHRVARGCLSGEGATKSAAKADLDAKIGWILANPGVTMECRYGLLIVIAAQPGGYQSSLVVPADMQHGRQKQCCTFHGERDYRDVLQSSRYHAAQVAWSPESDDSDLVAQSGLDAGKARDLQDWIAWQRRYLAAVAAGMTPNEAHHAASNLQA